MLRVRRIPVSSRMFHLMVPVLDMAVVESETYPDTDLSFTSCRDPGTKSRMSKDIVRVQQLSTLMGTLSLSHRMVAGTFPFASSGTGSHA